ncbi:hypothetical protein HHX38_13445 [Streptomyces sp. PKU-MA01144]|uniref:DUF6343 family protein n=1 Tax=Streptomyces TaxID=1883 RepID=UPI00147E1814|nr:MULTISPECIES: DUF6343 family protein [Streptomyces]MCY0979882.1 DUF6343 family protein [Streptomyces tirandamycinicus]NNJ05134.1 hypothetical protein [Streptomyces sp. PKU-MA01144]
MPHRTGTEPVTARSALTLRLVLSLVALPVFAAGTGLFAAWADASGPMDSPSPSVLVALAVVCGVLAVVAAADLLVIGRRFSHERHGGPHAR